MKVSQLFESEPLLRTLIQQRLAKGNQVKLDFWHEGFTYKGYISLLRGNTIHAVDSSTPGSSQNERFVLPLDVDDLLTLNKGRDDTWLVQKI